MEVNKYGTLDEANDRQIAISQTLFFFLIIQNVELCENLIPFETVGAYDNDNYADDFTKIIKTIFNKKG